MKIKSGFKTVSILPTSMANSLSSGVGTDFSKTLFSPATSIERERCHVSDREGRVGANGFSLLHKSVRWKFDVTLLTPRIIQDREGANFYSQVVVLIMQLQNLACKIMLIIIISMQIFSKKTKFSKNYKKNFKKF